MKTIALFGGSFDPPHNGHVAVVESALRSLEIDRLIIVPAYLNPFKSHACAPAELRLAWLHAIFDGAEGVEVSDFEVSKQRPVPSIETVRHFREQAERLYFIIGADNLASLTQWHAYDALDALVTWVVAGRDGTPVPERFITLDTDVPVSSTRLRRESDPNHLPPKIAEEITAYYKENNASTN